jgi:hypothetical protein
MRRPCQLQLSNIVLIDLRSRRVALSPGITAVGRPAFADRLLSPGDDRNREKSQQDNQRSHKVRSRGETGHGCSLLETNGTYSELLIGPSQEMTYSVGRSRKTSRPRRLRSARMASAKERTAP